MEKLHKTPNKIWLRPVFLAFVVPVLILLLVYIIRGVFPFGDKIYVRMDFYHQYAPFLKEFCNRIREGKSLLYAWELGLGTNYWAHFAYYLASPVNWLLVLVPEAFIIEAMNVSMVFRAGIAGACFVYFLKEDRKEKLEMAAFGIFYALSGYFLAYSCNIIWMDGYALFPLVALGVKRIATGKSARLYTISMLLCTFSNFYLAVIMGFACVLWFVICLISGRKKTFKAVFKAIVKFVMSTILFVCMSGVVLLPVAAALMNTPAGESVFPEKTEFYFALYELLERMCMNTDSNLKGSDFPNIYASVLVLVLLPLYFVNKRIRLRDKIVYGAALLFMLASFEINVLDYVWHGLHYPNSFPARQSFFYIFLVLVMGYETYNKRKKLSRPGIIISSLSLMLVTALGWIFLGKDNDSGGALIYLSTIIYSLIYATLLFGEKYTPKKLFLILFMVFCCLEAGVNTCVSGLDSVVSRSAYMEDDIETEALLADIMPGENEFYRVEEQDRKTVNDAAWDGYYGASYFSSTMPDGIKEWYDAFGLRNSSVSHSYDGATPLVTSLLGVRYVFAAEDGVLPGNTFAESEKIVENESILLYENETVLPLAYMVDEVVKDSFAYNYGNPFTTQNDYAKAVLGEQVSLFRAVAVQEEYGFQLFDEGAGAENGLNGESPLNQRFIIDIPAGENLFLYVTTYMEAINVEIVNVETGEAYTREFDDLKFKKILSIGVEDYDRRIVVTSGDDTVSDMHFYAYKLNEEILLQIYEALSADTMAITSFSETKIVGSIEADADGDLLFSVPYDEGWTVKVDGQEVETFGWKDAFLAISLEAGRHEISLNYCPVGFREGLILSLVGGIVGLTILVVSGNRGRKKKTLKNP